MVFVFWVLDTFFFVYPAMTLIQTCIIYHCIPPIQLTGSGPTQYVQLVKHPDAQEQPPKEKTPTTQPTAKGEKQQEQESKVQPQTQVEQLQGQAPPPPAAKKEEKPKVPEPSAAVSVQSPSKQVKQAKRQLDEKEAKRLSSETHRLLLCHQEHAMTLSELVECFRVGRDPASPLAEELYQCLKKNNSKGGGGKGQNNFQVRVNSEDLMILLKLTHLC